jgi:tetratricopeptide (TPR) repeat protein
MPSPDDPRPAKPTKKRSARNEPFPKSQLDFDIGFFGRILERNGDFVDVLRCQGALLSRKGLHALALAVDRRLAQLLPDDGVVRYNLACSLASSGQTTEAIEALRTALESGYDDFEYMEQDSDLDPLRKHPAYRALLRDFDIAG